MTKNTLMRFLIILTALIGASLACNLPANSSPNLPPTAKPMSTQEFQTLEQQIQATLTSPNANGEVSITLTQDQLNSLIASQMAQQSDQTITDTSVVLTNGQMEIYGKVNQSGISANLKVVLQPAVDANGDAKLNVASISLGGIPVPDVLKNRIESAADSAMSNTVNSNGFRAKSIAIAEGQMTVTGTRQP